MTLKEKIIEARSQGLTYDEISAKLDCSKSTISYHLSSEQKEKTLQRKRESRKIAHPYCKKIDFFLYHGRTTKTKEALKTKAKLLLDSKTRQFQRTQDMKTFTTQDVLDKFGENPRCYLTGRLIDIYDTSSYHFDHIVPVSRGGSSSIDNLGICVKDANKAKGDMMLEDFYKLCESVINERDGTRTRLP